MSNNDPMEEPLDFLLQPEKIKLFIEMLQKRIAAGENNLAQVNDQRKQIEDAIRGLKSKLKILQNYSKFIDLKGFAHTKQEADAYFKEMEQAQTTRLHVEEPLNDPWREKSDTCGQFYQLSNGLVGTCIKNMNHIGECSP